MDSGDDIIVRADEVDETGASVSVLSAATDAELTSQVEERSQEVADIGGTMPAPLVPGGPEVGGGGGGGVPAGVGPGERPSNLIMPGRSVPPPSEPRPIMRRDGSIPPPPPPKQPPPPAPPSSSSSALRDEGNNGGSMPSDSLSLAQLRNFVSNFQRMEPTAYAYSYADTRSFAEELEEWFQYSVEDRGMLRGMRAAFESRVTTSAKAPHQSPESWTDWPTEAQKAFVRECVRDLGDGEDVDASFVALEALAYVALGAWKSSAKKREQVDEAEEDDFEAPNDKFERSVGHIHSIRRSAKLLVDCKAVGAVYRFLRRSCPSEGDEDRDPGISDDSKAMGRQCMDVSLTILYAIIESGRWECSHDGDNSIRAAFCALEPNFLNFMCQQIARVRWDEDHELHLTRAIQILWKGMLLTLGSTDDLDKSKSILNGVSENKSKEKTESTLTTTPLDYHLFRQEIISKYPAYNPPPPLVPLEPENSSLLPPLPRTARSDSQSSLNIAPAKFNKSIFEQPVHITTPIPSPPPSPAGPGGKGGKKQNYQTNQNFPFLYPPLDSTSNHLGGKGGVALQDKLVGKRWEGGDVPASILEAGELFASRMRMSRGTRQLWEAREACIKYDRGWGGSYRPSYPDEDLDDDIQELKLDDDSDRSGEEQKTASDEEKPKFTPESSNASVSIQETEDPVVQQRLDLTDAFYRGSLPHLQSIVIVVLKILLANISATGGPAGSNQPSPALPQFPLDHDVDESLLPRANINLVKQLSNVSNGIAPPPQEDGMGGGVSGIESLNSTRTREITSKAISGMLLTMLKWFRFSHILKFQFLTQLLLDSNYLPLALKFFAMQDVDRAVDRKTDNEKLGFFEFCREDAGIRPEKTDVDREKEGNNGEEDEEEPQSALSGSLPESSDDEAQPPPIRRGKGIGGTESPPPLTPPATGGSPPSTSSPPPGSSSSSSSSPPPMGMAAKNRKPEVDELGYPTGPLPQRPLTTYSARFFFTTIAMLRVLQKISKGHAHRALLLVQYKSSTILRKALKIPQAELRLYTLKLFKSQVPFCGRKWRQANMRVITAIYVFCRMGLRDDWISGAGQVDDWVDNALATEQGWRGLAGWWHSRFYRDAVGVDSLARDEDDEDEDFFARELERMGWADHGLEGMDEEEQTDWEGGLLQPEGW